LDFAIKKWRPLLESVGVARGGEAFRLLKLYMETLIQWNKKVNLISTQSIDEIIVNHLVDSLMALKDPLAQSISKARCIDVGTGGGLPGFPLRILRPDWVFSFLDSVGKKTAFLTHLVEKCSLSNCMVITERAEELARQRDQREKYDFAFCRAVGSFSTILELTLPFVRVGGASLIHRGVEGKREAEEAEKLLQELGAQFSGLHEYELPNITKKRYIIRITKKQPMSDKYPRRTGLPAKRPLK